jgi:hypothetical protein
MTLRVHPLPFVLLRQGPPRLGRGYPRNSLGSSLGKPTEAQGWLLYGVWKGAGDVD